MGWVGNLNDSETPDISPAVQIRELSKVDEADEWNVKQTVRELSCTQDLLLLMKEFTPVTSPDTKAMTHNKADLDKME